MTIHFLLSNRCVHDFLLYITFTQTSVTLFLLVCVVFFLFSEDDVEGNLPRVLLCSHIYCTSCLLSIQYDGVIKCPECEVNS